MTGYTSFNLRQCENLTVSLYQNYKFRVDLASI